VFSIPNKIYLGFLNINSISLSISDERKSFRMFLRWLIKAQKSYFGRIGTFFRCPPAYMRLLNPNVIRFLDETCSKCDKLFLESS
jgi:hypothetical protein